MYKLKLVNGEKSILEFENNRLEAFGVKKTLTRMEESPYAQAIVSEDMLAFHCIEEDKIVGGMLIGLNGNDIQVERLFVKKEERGKGIGTFMVNYLLQHKNIFEDFYGIETDGILVEPIDTSIDFYYDQGFEYSGYQMYKSYS